MEAPVRVLRRYAPPGAPWLPGHRGVDLAAGAGDVVYAGGPGVVSFARDLAGRGVITVTHGQLRTTYEPVTALVRVGVRVAAGTPIGVMEADLGHCAPATCLHWGLRRGSAYLDPFALISLPAVRLLPHW
ncbi:hypothetical protein GCM10010468_07610 [Actinocorallia longicatena]|uniref:M23ase beta-sheet core domain-containing protein n=1 Tax=Actinocorallia longicatena TaxID=111803 RepID=A0ABP6PZQ8_9ACTN